MPIEFKDSRFHLYNERMSYCIAVTELDDLIHTYWGKRIYDSNIEFPLIERTSVTVYDNENNRDYSLEALPAEYPYYGTTDLREPAVAIELENGCGVIVPRYFSHKIYCGKPKIDGLPSVYAEADDECDTLEILLKDENSGVEITLIYTVFRDFDAISHSVRVKNVSDGALYINKICSASVDFLSDNYNYMHFYGAHCKERQAEICAVHKGVQGFESRRGASGHYENPFMTVMDKNADEEKGNVYGFSLVYSGNHSFRIESDNYEMMRVQLGINPFNFRWKLNSGESFSSPEAVMVYSSSGLGGMSRTYHKLYGTRLCRGKWRDEVRPILLNSWEAAYFDFDEEKLLKFAKKGKEAGFELFVLDDGWFGKRDDDTNSLGDWFVNRNKLPHGLDGLADKIHDMGLKFGLWFEPEMISKDSELFRKHPEWIFKVPGKEPNPARHQYILDLSRDEVCDYVIETISDVLKNADIDYVKWDMNRNMSDVYSVFAKPDRQRELMHRYILGLYKILEEITSRFPNILFESCASGGGRFDPGMLYYMPQVWTSDNTDALSRISIQYGTSMVYPASTMASHVARAPQGGRMTPLAFRAAVAMAGVFGYELDITKLSKADFDEIKEQVKLYKSIRSTVMFGDLYRLTDCGGTYSAWMYTDELRAVVTTVATVRHSGAARRRIKLFGLDENAVYVCDGKEYHGSVLVNSGIEFTEDYDFKSEVKIFEKIER